MEDQGRLHRVSSSRECSAVLEKEAGLFLRKRYQRAKRKRSGRSSPFAGFRIRAGSPMWKTGVGRMWKKYEGLPTKDPKKMIRKR